MNYYHRYCQDYGGKTAHLTMLEDGAYNRLLDWQYTNERPLPVAEPERVYGLARAMNPEQRKAVDLVVDQFFDEEGWNERAKAEIEAARPRINAAINNGKKNKGKPRKTPSDNSGPRGTTPPGSPPATPSDKPPDNPPGMPAAINREPTGKPVGELPNPHTPDIKEKAGDARAQEPPDPNVTAEFPAGWKPCAMSLAMLKQHAMPEPKPEHVAGFVGHWLGKWIEPRRIPGEFLKWMAKQKGFDARDAARKGGGTAETPATPGPRRRAIVQCARMIPDVGRCRNTTTHGGFCEDCEKATREALSQDAKKGAATAIAAGLLKRMQ